MSIASRIESIEEHIENAYDSIEALGVDITGVNKNIENISSSIDGIYDTLPKVTGEGESITLDGTIKGRLKSTLKGNTSQNGTPTPDTPIPVNVVSGDNSFKITGKNIFNKKITPNQTSSTTVEQLETGLRLITTSANIGIGAFYNLGKYTELQGRTITLSYKASVSGATKPQAYFGYCNENVSSRTRVSEYYVDTGEITLTINIDNTYYNESNPYIFLYLSSRGNGTTGDRQAGDYVNYENLMIEFNTTKTQYESYNSNTYNINLPVENLFDGTQVTTTNPSNWGITFENNVLTLEHKTAYSSGAPNIVLGTLPSGNYTVSYTSTNRMSLYIDGVYDQLLDNGETFTAENGKTYAFYFSVADNSTVTFTNIMLVKGTKANSYTPYGTTPIELCKIDDCQDYFYKYNGKWHSHKEIGKNTITVKSSSLSNGGSFLYTASRDYIPNARQQGNQKSRNFFSNKNGFSEPNVDYSTYPAYAIATQLVIQTTLDDNIDNYKSKCNGAIIYYQLATPTDTEIIYQPLIEQLNNLEKAMSYNGQTNISQVNNDLPFVISASALKEWQESNVSTLSMVNPLSLGNTLNTQENDIQPIEVDNIEPLEEEEYEED